MGALPKRRISKARQANKRAHWKLRLRHLVPCPQCGALKRPHHVCMTCGMYRDTQVLEVEQE